MRWRLDGSARARERPTAPPRSQARPVVHGTCVSHRRRAAWMTQRSNLPHVTHAPMAGEEARRRRNGLGESCI